MFAAIRRFLNRRRVDSQGIPEHLQFIRGTRELTDDELEVIEEEFDLMNFDESVLPARSMGLRLVREIRRLRGMA